MTNTVRTCNGCGAQLGPKDSFTQFDAQTYIPGGDSCRWDIADLCVKCWDKFLAGLKIPVEPNKPVTPEFRR